MSAQSPKKNQSADNQDEIDVLLNDFGRNLSGVSGVVFYGMALIVATIPLWLYWRIHMMDPMANYIPWTVMCLVSAFLIAKVGASRKTHPGISRSFQSAELADLYAFLNLV